MSFSFVQHSRLGDDDEDEELEKKDKKPRDKLMLARQNKRTFGIVQSLVSRKEIVNKWAEPLQDHHSV